MDSDWQNASLQKRISYILETATNSDCCFYVGSTNKSDRKLIRAHKLILSMASPVFERMFYGSMPENSDQPIPIDDIDEDDFNDLLYFVYTDEINFISIEKAQKLYYAAKKYMLSRLAVECIQFLIESLNAENVLNVFDFATNYEESDLIKKCMEVLKSQTYKVLNTTSWLHADLKLLKLILQQDELNISSELELFNALERYAEFRFSIDERRKPNSTECQDKTSIKTSGENHDFKENVAGKSIKEEKEFLDLVKQIRFLNMSAVEFARGPALSKLLKTDDALAISVCLMDSENIEEHFPKDFCDLEDRCCKRSAVFSCYTCGKRGNCRHRQNY